MIDTPLSYTWTVFDKKVDIGVHARAAHEALEGGVFPALQLWPDVQLSLEVARSGLHLSKRIHRYPLSGYWAQILEIKTTSISPPYRKLPYTDMEVIWRFDMERYGGSISAGTPLIITFLFQGTKVALFLQFD